LEFDPSGGDRWDGVYREVSVNGDSYQYEYDAVGRRRAKHYPASDAFDEFFYDDSRMVEDRAADTQHDAAYTGTYPLDEYLWLDGKPVVLIKSELDEDASGAMTVRSRGDSTASCDRGDGAACGLYFLVDDVLGKPVLMVDSQGRATGEAEYTPFGLPNRVTYLADTAHPNVTADDKRVLAFFHQPHPSGESVRLRARFAMLDVGVGNSVEMADSSGTAVNGGTVTGLHSESLLGPWVAAPQNGLLQLRFRGWASASASGVTLAGYEYQRYQTGATPTWTRLGFPGQYYDPETDLFENWHRFYDANTGRYLEPDPLWKYPEKLVARLSSGRFDPVYAYGANDPLTANDPDGREVQYVDASGNPLTASSSSEDLLLMSRAMDSVDAVASADTVTGVSGDVQGLRDSKQYVAVFVIAHGALYDPVNGKRVNGFEWHNEGPSGGGQGLLSVTEDVSNDTTFEGIVAHEIGHAAARYSQWLETGSAYGVSPAVSEAYAHEAELIGNGVHPPAPVPYR